MGAATFAQVEIFARSLARGQSGVKAYRAAGFSKRSHNASQFARRPDVVARVAELIAEREDRRDAANADLEEALAQDGAIKPRHVLTALVANALEAKRAGQFAASNRALELIGKHQDMFQGGTVPNTAAATNAAPRLDLGEVRALLSHVGINIDRV